MPASASGICFYRYTGFTEKGTLLLAFLPFFFGYGFGQALTDCFQTDTDKLSAPYRPISRGIVNVWAAGPFYNAWIVALLPAMGYFALSGPAVNRFPVSYLPFLAVGFYVYANFVLIGYLKDIDADRATAYKTFPVVWGWKKTILAGDVFAALPTGPFWFAAKHNAAETIAGLAGSFVIIAGQHTPPNSKARRRPCSPFCQP